MLNPSSRAATGRTREPGSLGGTAQPAGPEAAVHLLGGLEGPGRQAKRDCWIECSPNRDWPGSYLNLSAASVVFRDCMGRLLSALQSKVEVPGHRRPLLRSIAVVHEGGTSFLALACSTGLGKLLLVLCMFRVEKSSRSSIVQWGLASVPPVALACMWAPVRETATRPLHIESGAVRWS